MMGNMTALARPYAIAAFEFALAEKNIAAWQAMLEAAVCAVQHPAVIQLLKMPSMSQEKVANLICDVLSQVMDKAKNNFIHLLAEHDRLTVLPAIAELFKQYHAAQDKELTVQVQSAVPLQEDYQQKLINQLTKKLQRKVSLACDIDPALLGGILVRAGDMVIDGSVRGKLNRLLESIS